MTLQRSGILILCMYCILALGNAEPAPESASLYREPLSGDEFTTADQDYLWCRARGVEAILPNDLVTTTVSVAAYMKSPDHAALKAKLRTFVDNKTAWPEYVYVARITPKGDKYETLASSSDIIEKESVMPFELASGMLQAVKLERPVAVDFASDTPAVYIPIMKGGKTAGFLVFVKQSWGPQQRRAMATADFREDPTTAKLRELDARVAVLELRVKDMQGSRPKADPPGEEATTPTASGIGLADYDVLSYGNGQMVGKQSMGGTGESVRFERPDGSGNKLEYIEICGSRYGMPQPPNEDFDVYVLDEQSSVIRTLKFPYGTFERGPEKWVALRVGGVEVPKVFQVAVDFHAHQTKGVYIGTSQTGGVSHSFVGTPAKGFEPFVANRDWMIRACLAKPEPEKAK